MTFLAGDPLPASDLNDFAPGGDISLTSGGEISWNADTNLYRGAANQLKTDDPFRAASFTENSGAVTVADTQNTIGTTTSNSYTATLSGGTACGVAFVAPASGVVLIFNVLQIQAASGNSFCTVRVRTGSSVGSGSDVLAAGDDDSVIVNSAGSLFRGTAVLRVTGLTPGSSYNAQQLFKNDASATCTTTRKKLIVQPVMM